ncbi:MAG: protein kinase [Ferruginibacter sp.]
MIGQQIQNYIIISKLGQGGMGTVYKAVDNVLGREVALKMLNTLMINQPQVLDRFKKEAQVLARLLHPNIAVIYNLIEQEQQHFMVMEYVEGKNLDEVLRQHKTLPYKMVVLIFMQALEGLHHAHKKGIYHRDIKPSNLILTPDGTVKLMDFGIAKVAGEQRMTQLNKVIGTIEFLAPEIIEGKEPSVSSDIYAAAVTMYELLSGKLPFESSTDYNLMQEILKKKPVTIDKLNVAIPKALSNIVMKALEKKPENRFSDAGAFQQALAAAFPELRGIDLSSLNRQLETAYATPLTQVIAQPQKNISNASLQATRLESTTKPSNIFKTFRVKANDGFQNIQQKYLPTIRSRVIASSILLLLLIFLGFSIFSKDSDPNKGTAENIQPKVKVPGNETVDNQNTGNTNITPVREDIPRAAENPPAVDPIPVDDQQGKEQERREQEKREQAKREKEKKDQEKLDQQKREEEKQESEPPVQKTVERREVYIRSKVAVDLYLRENLANAPERRDIQVSFTVTSPVVFDGVTIIRQGAVANGVIKLGKVMTDIDITSVTGANGQHIRLKALRGHGRRNGIVSDRNYSAIIEPGTRMSF